MNKLPMVPEEPLTTPDATHETESLVADPAKTDQLRAPIQTALKKVYDPEIPVDVWELGLIYDLFVTAGGVAAIRMTLTAPGRPAAQVLPGEVAAAAKSVPGITDAKVDGVWDPGWTKHRIAAI